MWRTDSIKALIEDLEEGMSVEMLLKELKREVAQREVREAEEEKWYKLHQEEMAKDVF